MWKEILAAFLATGTKRTVLTFTFKIIKISNHWSVEIWFSGWNVRLAYLRPQVWFTAAHTFFLLFSFSLSTYKIDKYTYDNVQKLQFELTRFTSYKAGLQLSLFLFPFLSSLPFWKPFVLSHKKRRKSIYSCICIFCRHTGIYRLKQKDEKFISGI